ncbi:MAG: branched-chain amino acid ABC transporter permease [Syntrophales bacterium]|nr:branched-chain amino acid ABC transporter permease [Syntrophales bacterium]MDD5642523.1 branched-chain amino acid ABC transporter permease [Syntrophales bacterium]
MSAYFLHLAILGGIYIILAISLNLIIGYAGQVSLGHAAFFGIGAYISALTSLYWGFPFLLAALSAILFSGVCGLLLGLPTLRLKEDYLAIVTLGFGVIVDLVFLNLEITGGPDGLAGIPSPRILGLSFRSPVMYLFLTLFMVLLTLALTYRLVHSYHGRALRAIRDHEVTAQVMGINTPAYKVAIFTLAAALAGLAGSLYAHYITFINPESFGLHTSILALCMVVLGGMGSIAGAVVGALALTVLPELLRSFKAYQDLIYGGLLVALLIWRPEGLLGRGKLSLKFISRE